MGYLIFFLLQQFDFLALVKRQVSNTCTYFELRLSKKLIARRYFREEFTLLENQASNRLECWSLRSEIKLSKIEIIKSIRKGDAADRLSTETLNGNMFHRKKFRNRRPVNLTEVVNVLGKKYCAPN